VRRGRHLGPLWGEFLERLTASPDSKVFTLSGTPCHNRAEMLLQLELIHPAAARADPAALLHGAGWERRLARYARGRVSYVDGARDLSRFPANAGVAMVECGMAVEQLHNFGTRCVGLLRMLGFGGFDAMAAALRGAAGARRRIAVLAARLTQAAGTVHWGGRRAGLRRALAEGPTLDALGCFAPKFRRVAEALLPPPGTESLETKHFVYSGSKARVDKVAPSRSRSSVCATPPAATHSGSSSRRPPPRAGAAAPATAGPPGAAVLRGAGRGG
jgi:hypothetical protein